MADSERLLQENEQLRREMESLRRENSRLAGEAKKLKRSNGLLEAAIERSRVAAAAKDSLSRAVAEKRSELERYMNLLLGNCPDMILLFNREEELAYCTESFLAAKGLPSFGLIKGTPCGALFGEAVSATIGGRLKAIYGRIYRDGATVEFTDALRFAPGGAVRQYNIQVSPMVNENGGAEGSMIILSDTTEILAAQQEAERANAAKSDFLATVSHEIRTPMNAIIGLSEMLKSSGLDDRQHEYLKNIQDSSAVLLNLINDILDFSKIEAGKLDINAGFFEFDGLFRHVRGMFELMFEKKGLAFLCESEPGIPEILYGDESRIRQILTNLLNNALKYTKRGSVRFSAGVGAEGEIVLRVTDTGIGIAPEAIPQLFDAFERMDPTGNKGVVGTGLGLAITKRLCDLMGGTIEVASVYGEGTTFTVRLPLPAGTRADLPPDTIREAVAFMAPEARVLVVDDIDINLQVTEYMLAVYDIRVDFASDGSQAVDKAAARRYDLILMDHMMPVMDGVAAAEAIRAGQGPSRDTPIIALTANAMSGARERFMEKGFDGFLSKPIDAPSLAKCLLEWLPADKVRMLG